MKIVTVELTIEKSDWLDENALLRAIQERLKARLATGGCVITEARIIDQPCTPSCTKGGGK